MSDKDEKEILQRVARLEQRVDDRKEIDKKRESQMESINSKLDRMELDLARYRGLVGGVLLVVTAIVSFAKFFWEDTIKFFGK